MLYKFKGMIMIKERNKPTKKSEINSENLTIKMINKK